MPLAEIFGHAPVIALLRKAVSRQRVPQSLLFAGSSGVGKRAVAMALAQAVNCPVRRQAHGDDACGQCPTCLRIARGQHTDVAVVDKGEDASIKIDVIRRRVLDVIGYRPFEGARRVFIIDPADDMGDAAQDALLKTLEEPPPSAILILISEYPDLLSLTIQSRCRRLRFGPLSEADVARVLLRTGDYDAARAQALAAVSGGSVGRALAEAEGDLGEPRALALALLAAARGRDVVAKLRTATNLAKHGKNERAREVLGGRLIHVASIVRDLGVIASGSPASLANVDLDRDLQKLSPAFDLARVAHAYDVLGQAQEALDRNASPKIVADWVAASI